MPLDLQTLVDLQQGEIATLRERVRQLEAMLAPPGLVIPIEWRLTPAENRLLAYLLTRPMATKEQIMEALYSTRPGEAPETKIVDVFVCKMRAKLKSHDVAIDTYWGQGYGLADREQLLKRLQGKLAA